MVVIDRNGVVLNKKNFYSGQSDRNDKELKV